MAGAGGFRERQRQKTQRRIVDAIGPQLQPDEELREWVLAQVRPRLFLGMEAFLGPLVTFTIRVYCVATTNERLFALRVAKTPGKDLSIELAEPFAHVRIDRRKSGPLWSQVWVRRLTDGASFRFRIVRTERQRAQRVFDLIDPA